MVSLCVSSFSRPRILLIEKSVSFRGGKTDAKDRGESSRDFLDCVDSTRETTDLKLKLSIIAELINLLQSLTAAEILFTE